MHLNREFFNGSLPKPLVSQMIEVLDVGKDITDIYVGCSGTFTFERMFHRLAPKARLHSNDVSLLSQGLAALRLGNMPPIRFKGRISHWEDRLSSRSDAERFFAAMVAMWLGRNYRSDNEYNRAHWLHHEAHLQEHMQAMADRAKALMDQAPIASYYSGDFRDHLASGKGPNSLLVVSAPFIEKWYEKWFRAVDEMIVWNPPDYRVWNPSDMPALLNDLEAAGRYLVVYKFPIEGRTPSISCQPTMGSPPFLVYTNISKRASTVHYSLDAKTEPFRFRVPEIADFGSDAKCEVMLCSPGQSNYIKRTYLQEDIIFSAGHINFLVYVNNALLGTLSYKRSTTGHEHFAKTETVYLLSDTSTTRYFRVSKLLALLACSEEVLAVVERKLTRGGKILSVCTSVRTNAPVSMKYRTIYRVVSRTEPVGQLANNRYLIRYARDRDRRSVDEIYRDWRNRYFKDDRNRRLHSSYEAPK